MNKAHQFPPQYLKSTSHSRSQITQRGRNSTISSFKREIPSRQKDKVNFLLLLPNLLTNIIAILNQRNFRLDKSKCASGIQFFEFVKERLNFGLGTTDNVGFGCVGVFGKVFE